MEWKKVMFEDGVDTKISTHAANASAHHAKYTDAEAVTALATADVYVKNIGDISTGALKVQQSGYYGYGNIDTQYISLKDWGNWSSGPSIQFQKQHNEGSCVSDDELGFFAFKGESGSSGLQDGAILIAYADGDAAAGYVPTILKLGIMQSGGSLWYVEFDKNKKMDLNDGIIKDPKNHVHSALSGTKKLVEIDIGGASYYFEVYPTKA